MSGEFENAFVKAANTLNGEVCPVHKEKPIVRFSNEGMIFDKCCCDILRNQVAAKFKDEFIEEFTNLYRKGLG